MGKNRLRTIMAAVVCAAMISIPCLASATEQSTTIPVTLTVINSVKNIDVTMPAAMPVSVLDGKVLTADNVAITNNSAKVDVEIVSVTVENGSYTVADYEAFPDQSQAQIAMQINGCSTKGPGALDISGQSFPNVAAGTSLPINYKAKVSDSADVSGLKVANVIFTLRAAEGE